MSNSIDPASQAQLDNAAQVLREGGVIAYPTEFCFGLGCDPKNDEAVARLLAIKQRKREQGVILIAANIDQIEQWVEFEDSPIKHDIQDSWPGPNTWVLPALMHVTPWIKGHHTSVAVRVTAHVTSRRICEMFGGAIVSTSANRHGQDALLSASVVERDMGKELDYVLDAPLGGASAASTIRDGQTGQQLR